MNTINEVLERLEVYLHEFESSNKANDARKIGEAVCRIILLNSDKQITQSKSIETKFQVLIDSLNKNNLSEDENHLKKIKADLNTIQTFGNIESHDSGNTLNEHDLIALKKSVQNLLRNVFDNKDYIDIDEKIPVSIYNFIEKTVTENEDWRCDKIISIVYPNRVITKIEEQKDFQFYSVSDVNNKKIGFVFLGRNISFSKSLETLFKSNKAKIKEHISLTFLFPKEISKTTGKEVKDRKKTIQNKCISYISDCQRIEFSYEFIEDYIWNYCLTSKLKEVSNVATDPFFIDQWLYNESSEQLSLDFLDDIIKNKHKDNKPIHILLGGGGVGKTTFCTQAIERLDRLLASGSKKKALLLSSFDLPDELNSYEESIDSIQSLYRILQDDPDTTLDSHNLALNISSGNLLIFIDGLDEIESKLKEKFNLDAFIESVTKLNDTYLNCTVIITSRENNSDKFDLNKINIYQLKGFDEELIQKYLKTRYGTRSKHRGKGYEKIVSDYVSEISIESNKIVTPLIVRLLCELVEAQETSGDIAIKSESKYFKENKALDKVIYQIINRDIIKQDIKITCDDYFEILKDIVFENNSTITKAGLDELLEYSLIDMSEEKIKDFTSFYVSPLLQRVGSNFRIKYDSLEFWVKARFISHQINTHSHEQNTNVLKVLARDCYNGGSLVSEIKDNITQDKPDYFSNTLKTILNKLVQSDFNIQLARKIISSLLYLAMPIEIQTKNKYSEILLSLFGKNTGERIRYLSIYGEFFPLNFRDFISVDGYFNEFNNLAKSSFPENDLVFVDCEFKNIDTKLFSKNTISHQNFKDCILPDNMKELIKTGEKSKQDQINNIKSDLKKIFKVGFKQNAFVWKSEQLYKQQCASLKHNLILSNYFEILGNKQFLNCESAKGSANNGYKLNNTKESQIQDFITQGIISYDIQELIDSLMS
ncbi:NACHT domain-containing NTPase [Aeromonas hydrophila]|uniref:NACHT domain-containing protein n=1 Tax=Aeromonas hydrophila TaxID=644 RepID=UPI0038D03177